MSGASRAQIADFRCSGPPHASIHHMMKSFGEGRKIVYPSSVRKRQETTGIGAGAPARIDPPPLLTPTRLTPPHPQRIFGSALPALNSAHESAPPMSSERRALLHALARLCVSAPAELMHGRLVQALPLLARWLHLNAAELAKEVEAQERSAVEVQRMTGAVQARQSGPGATSAAGAAVAAGSVAAGVPVSVRAVPVGLASPVAMARSPVVAVAVAVPVSGRLARQSVVGNWKTGCPWVLLSLWCGE
mgnify:CR=1 FL=1